jgi:hypothetical protein
VRDVVNAAVDALKGDSTLETLLGSDAVYTHIPQGTNPPYAMVMGGDEVPWAVTFDFGGDDGDSGGRQVDVTVQCVSTYRGSLQVDAMASRVMELLTDATTWVAVAGFQLAEFLRNIAQPPIDLNGDGVLWFIRLVTIRVSLA